MAQEAQKGTCKTFTVIFTTLVCLPVTLSLKKKKKEVGGSVFLRLRLQKINVKWNKRPSFSVDDLKSLSDTGDNALTADVSNSCCREIRIFAFKKCTFKILISRLMVTLLH